MNMKFDTVRDAAADLDDGPTLPADEVRSYSIRQDSLNGLSMNELSNICDVLRTTDTVITGLLCRPCFETGDGNKYNDAGNILEDFVEFVRFFELAALDNLRSARPQSPRDIEEKAWALLRFDTQMHDSLSDLAVNAAEAVRDIMQAKARAGGREQA